MSTCGFTIVADNAKWSLFHVVTIDKSVCVWATCAWDIHHFAELEFESVVAGILSTDPSCGPYFFWIPSPSITEGDGSYLSSFTNPWTWRPKQRTPRKLTMVSSHMIWVLSTLQLYTDIVVIQHVYMCVYLFIFPSNSSVHFLVCPDQTAPRKKGRSCVFKTKKGRLVLECEEKSTNMIPMGDLNNGKIHDPHVCDLFTYRWLLYRLVVIGLVFSFRLISNFSVYTIFL